MPLDQFLIAPITEGLQTNIEPWLLPEVAFSKLQNAYVWRGRVRKRFGSTHITTASSITGYEQLNSRLRVKVGTTDGVTGNLAGVAPGYTVGTTGQMFSIETNLFTVYQAGAPVDMLKTGGSATTYTFDTTSGAFAFVAADTGKDVYWYPALPVMGLLNYEVAAINDEPTFAFDTRMAYSYAATGWSRLGTALWTGSDSQFFWGENHRGTNSFDRLLFVTNNSSTDHVRYWNGATWTNFQPQYTTTAGDRIEGCRVIISFKNRLILLNTYERINSTGVTSNHSSRIRYSQKGTPLPTVGDEWYEEKYTAGKGGFLDATTKEAIISAKVLRDRVIVFFERSTWELVTTGNEQLPFVFQRINSELGVESTFSTVLFDKVLLGVGNVGIHACNGANVDRIDQKIPKEVFKFHNGNDGVERVYGIRDYHAEMVYWTLPDHNEDPVFPTKVLVYNYKNKTWSINDDTITCFGYLQNLNDETWQMVSEQWQTKTDIWNDGTLQSEFRRVVAGNQEGYTFLIDEDSTRNAAALQITQLANAAGVVTVTAINHNLFAGDFVIIEKVLGDNGVIPAPVDMKVDGLYQVIAVPDADTFTINEPLFAGVYTGAGTVERVSQIDIETKAYNFYQKQGKNLYIPKVGYYVDRTAHGIMSVDYFTSSSDLSMVSEGQTSGAIQGTSLLETTPYDTVPLELTQDRFWHIMYPQAEGELIKMKIYVSDTQLTREADSSNKDEIFNIAVSDFRLNAINIYSKALHRY